MAEPDWNDFEVESSPNTDTRWEDFTPEGVSPADALRFAQSSMALPMAIMTNPLVGDASVGARKEIARQEAERTKYLPSFTPEGIPMDQSPEIQAGFEQAGRDARQYPSQALEGVGSTLAKIVSPTTWLPESQQPKKFVIDTQAGTLNQYPEEIAPPGKPLYEPNSLEPNWLQRTASGMSTPGNLLAAGLTLGESPIAQATKAYFAGEGTMGTAEAAAQLLAAKTPQERKEAVEGLPLNLAMAIGGIKGLKGEPGVSKAAIPEKLEPSQPPPLLNYQQSLRQGPEAIKAIMSERGIDRDAAVELSRRSKEFHGILKTPATIGEKGELNAPQERQVQESVQPEREGTSTQRVSPETSLGDSVQPETKVQKEIKQGDILPDYDPEDVGMRSRLNQKKSEGKTHEQAGAEMASEHDAVANQISKLSPGTRVRNKQGQLYENMGLKGEQADWNEVNESTGDTIPGSVATSQNLRGGKIERVGNGRKVKTPEWAEALPPTPVGVTRVFHGEGGAEGGGLGGAWFTTNPERAAGYGENVSYVDVPDAVAESAKVPGTKGDVDLSAFPELLKQSEPIEGAKATVHEIAEEPSKAAEEKAAPEEKPAETKTDDLSDVKTLTPAVKSADGRIMTGASHVEASRRIISEWEQPPTDQGFVTDKGKFLTRAEALEVFKKMEPGHTPMNPNGLYSEDLAATGRLAHMDAARYDKLVTDMRDALKKGDFDTFTRIQREVQQIENRKKTATQETAKPAAETNPEVKPAESPVAESPKSPEDPAFVDQQLSLAESGKLSTFGPVQQAVEAMVEKAAPAVGEAVKAVKEIGVDEANPSKMTDERRAALNWSAKEQRSFGEAAEWQSRIQKAVKDPVRREAITNWLEAGGDVATLRRRAAASTDPKLARGYMEATKLTPEEAALANAIKSKFGDLFKRGEAADVIGDHRDNYVTHIWDLGKGPSMGGTRTLRDQFRFNRARTFDTFFDGEQAGYKPKTKDISKILPAYLHEMEHVIASRELVQEMSKGKASDGRPLVVPKGVGIPVDGTEGRATLVMPKTLKEDFRDYKSLPDQPALNKWKWVSKDEAGNPVFLKSDLALHPEAYKRLKAALGKSAIKEWYQNKSGGLSDLPKWTVQGLDNANSITKQTMLGVLSPFHQVQEATHAFGHKVNPMFNIPKIDLMRDPAQMDAARHGLMLQPDRASAEQFMEGFKNAGVVSKIPGIGPLADWYSNYLFHEYIPGIKYKTYSAILERNLDRYKPEMAAGKIRSEEVKALSAQQANAAFGHLNYTDLSRSQTIQHFARLGILAPDFLEARSRFAGQAIKGLAGGKVGREQLVALATLALGQATLAYTSAKLTGGDWDPKHPFEMHAGNRRYTLRSVPEDLYNMVNHTREFVHNRLSVLGKTGFQAFEGVDWRGRKVTTGQTLKEAAQQPIPLMAKGFLGVGNTSLNGWEQLLSAVGLRISRFSADSEVNDMADKWRGEAGPKQQAELARRQQETLADSDYKNLREALNMDDYGKAKKEYESLLEKKKSGEIFKAMRPFTVSDGLRHDKGFAGLSQKETRAFLKTLSADDRKLYEQAKKERDDTFQKFKKLKASVSQEALEPAAAPY